MRHTRRAALLLIFLATLHAFAQTASPAASPRHLRFQRAIELPPNTTGQACVILDGAVFSDAATRSTTDLRLFATTTPPSRNAHAAEVPFVFAESGAAPSNQATRYTTVARTSLIRQSADDTFAILRVPAHLPIERVSFLLDPAFNQPFHRTVTVTDAAIVRGGSGFGEAEALDADISGPPPDRAAPGFDAALGANLRSTAEVRVTVHNADAAPIPLLAVELQMRQRVLCFQAAAGLEYTLRYGDAALPAPVYDYVRLFRPSAAPVYATLGPEQRNPAFVAREDDSYTARHPELLWLILLAILTLAGVVTLQRVRAAHHRLEGN